MAAWGALQKGGRQLHIRSYELGVLLLPSLEQARARGWPRKVRSDPTPPQPCLPICSGESGVRLLSLPEQRHAHAGPVGKPCYLTLSFCYGATLCAI